MDFGDEFNDKAAADFERVIALRPNAPAGYAGRADLRRYMGDLEGALADLDRVVELAPQPTLYVLRSQALCEYGLLARARSGLEEGGRRFPREKSIILEQRRVQYAWDSLRVDRRKDLVAQEEARLRAKAILDAAPELARLDAAVEADPDAVASLLARAQKRFDLQMFDEAAADYRRAAELAPEVADHQVWLGRTELKREDYAAAAQSFTRAIRLSHDKADILNWRGLARSSSGDQRGAIADYTAAIRLAPEVDIYWMNRGWSKRLAGHWNSLNDYQTAKQKNNAASRGDLPAALKSEAWTNAAGVERRRRSILANIREIETARRFGFVEEDGRILSDKSDAEAYFTRGEKYAAADWDGAAASDFRRALELGHRVNESRFRLVRSLVWAGQPFEATVLLTEELADAPEDVGLLVLRAQVLMSRGRRDAAIDDCEAALKIDPSNEFARENLERAKGAGRTTKMTAAQQRAWDAHIGRDDQQQFFREWLRRQP